MGILTEKQLKGLDAHVYSCEGKSLLEPVFQIFWTWLDPQLPLWLAPNLVTFIGLLINTATGVLVFIYSPHVVEEAPWWILVSFAVGPFAYQALDAVDGKQARRTNSSSPLGELFDHGCDAVSSVLLILVLGCSMQLGEMPSLLFVVFVIAQWCFFSTHWRAYSEGKVFFGQIDVTEVELIIMGVVLVSAVCGYDFWKRTAFGFEYRLLIMAGCMSLAAWSSLVHGLRACYYGIGKQGGISPGVVYGTTVCLFVYSLAASPSSIASHQPLMTGVLFGTVSAKLSINMVIAHMSNCPATVFDSILLAPVMVGVNVALGAPLAELTCVIAACVYGIANLVVVESLLCLQMSEHMGIYCFSLGKHVSKSK